MNPEEECFEYYQELADRYQLNLNDLQNIESIKDLLDGYCVVPSVEDRLYICAYKDKALIAEGSQLEVYDFIILRLFIDKYSTGKYELPELTDLRVVGQSAVDAIKENHKIMEVILSPLNIYDDLLERFKESREKLSINPMKIETFDGHESKEDGCRALNGERPDYEAMEYRVIKFVKEDVWDVFFKKERSNDLNFMLRIYGRRYLHEYILNNHIGAVG